MPGFDKEEETGEQQQQKEDICDFIPFSFIVHYEPKKYSSNLVEYWSILKEQFNKIQDFCFKAAHFGKCGL